MKKITVLFILALALLLVACGGEAELGTEDNPIAMSFVPSGDTEDIVASGDQLAQMISERTGLVIESEIGTNFAAVREAMGAGQAHIGWLNTFNYVLANEQYNVDVGLSGAWLQHLRARSSSAPTAARIRGRSGRQGNVLVDPNPLRLHHPPDKLAAQGSTSRPPSPMRRSRHPSEWILRVQRDCDAGATFSDARSEVEEELPDVMEQVVVLTETAAIPNDSVSFIEEFPEEMRAEIEAALLDIASTEEGAAALEQLYSISGLQEADDSFYDEFARPTRWHRHRRARPVTQ